MKSFEKNIEVAVFNPLVLEVVCAGNSTPTISWIKDKLPLVDSERIKLSSEALPGEQMLHRLVIDSSLNEDEGNYIAKVKNPLGELTAQTKVDILFAPKFVKELAAEYMVKEHEVAKFMAEISANPKAEITWCKKVDNEDTARLSTNEKFKLEEQKNNALLTMKDALLKDSGVYVCTARNKIGEATTETKLNVCVPPKFFKQPDTNTEVEITKEYSTSCVIRGFPIPDIKFVEAESQKVLVALDDGLVDVKSNVISDTEVECFLTIRSVTLDTPVTYECVATNIVGEVKCKFEMKLIKKPDFVKKPDEVISLQLNKDIVLECGVSAAPNAAISWWKDGKKLSASKRLLITELKEDTPKSKVNIHKAYSLRILSATKEDSGVYEVVAVNKLGEERCSSTLTIEYAPLIVKDLKAKEKAVEDNSFTYAISVKGCPKPNINW